MGSTLNPMTSTTATDLTATANSVAELTALCALDELTVGWGEAALTPVGQCAVFRHPNGTVYVSAQHCPATGSAVMSRGILGSRLIDDVEIATIASPLHKEVYRLDTGEGLTKPELSLAVYPVQIIDGTIWAQLTAPVQHN